MVAGSDANTGLCAVEAMRPPHPHTATSEMVLFGFGGWAIPATCDASRALAAVPASRERRSVSLSSTWPPLAEGQADPGQHVEPQQAIVGARPGQEGLCEGPDGVVGIADPVFGAADA